MMTHIEKKGGKQGLVKKATGFMTSSRCMAKELGVTCPGGHEHVPLVGGRAAGAQVYPKELCEAIVRGVVKQKLWDKSNKVSTMGMNKRQLNSFTSSLTRQIRTERISMGQGHCSSVTRDGSLNRPNGEWPVDWVDAVHEEEGGADYHGVRPQQGAEAFKESMYALVCKNSMWKA